MTDRPKWPQEELSRGVVEYKREQPRGPREITSYLVATTYGLLLGRAYSRRRGTVHPWWFAEGWTPATDGKRLGPFETRWEAFQALADIEHYGRWPSRFLVKRIETPEAA